MRPPTAVHGHVPHSRDALDHGHELEHEPRPERDGEPRPPDEPAHANLNRLWRRYEVE